jgi:hypothetical protein
MKQIGQRIHPERTCPALRPETQCRRKGLPEGFTVNGWSGLVVSKANLLSGCFTCCFGVPLPRNKKVRGKGTPHQRDEKKWLN